MFIIHQTHISLCHLLFSVTFFQFLNLKLIDFKLYFQRLSSRTFELEIIATLERKMANMPTFFASTRKNCNVSIKFRYFKHFLCILQCMLWKQALVVIFLLIVFTINSFFPYRVRSVNSRRNIWKWEILFFYYSKKNNCMDKSQ